MTETWNLFNGNDIIFGLLGALGFVSMVVVIFTASSRVDKREKVLSVARTLEEYDRTLRSEED